MLQEFLKSFCESDFFIKDRRKILRKRAGLTDDDKNLAMPSAINYMLVSAIILYMKDMFWAIGRQTSLNISHSPGIMP